jgi:hypothetical protein
MDERTTECLSGTMDITIICGHDDVGGKNARVEVTRRAIEMMGGPPGRLLVFFGGIGMLQIFGRDGPPVSVSRFLSAGQAAQRPQSIWVSCPIVPSLTPGI